MLPLEITSSLNGPLNDSGLLDTCGTGGSGLNTFNTSTAAAFVAAAAGQPVAKHGNRAATSACGSADVLRELGVNLELTITQLAECLAATNFCFFFAPNHHPATKRVQVIRRELGVRTIFNFLGPLSNPAGATRQLLGVSQLRMVVPMAEALRVLGARHALVVRGEDGLDEISTTGPSLIAEVKDGEVSHYTISPEDFGLPCVSFAEIEGGLPRVAASRMRAVLEGERNAYSDLVALNAGAALYISGKAESIGDGVGLARTILSSKAALEVLENVIRFSKTASR
jgi:anthranilate phosphoribosyltransferase